MTSWFFFTIVFFCIFTVYQDDRSNASDRNDKDTTVPLNLSADTADDKKVKRAAASEAESAELDRMKRVKSEQTEATDLSMKNPSTASSQSRLNNHTVLAIH